MKTFPNDFFVADEDCSDHGVGTGESDATNRQFEREVHEKRVRG
jgi:hypothetical protein